MVNLAAGSREQYIRHRAFFMVLLAGLGFLGLVFRCFLIQVAQREHYLTLSNKNRLKAIPLEAMRGLVLDRNGKVLVDNRASYSVALIPLELKDKDERSIVRKVAELLRMDPADIQARIKKGKRRSFEPIRLQRNVDFGTLSVLEENREKFPGVIYQVEPQRVYVRQRSAAHLLGYIDEMTEKEEKALKKKGYFSNELVGRNGIEKSYEQFLRGTPGMRYYTVNAVGRKIGEEEKNFTPPRSGNNLYLTIDLALQEAAEAAMPESTIASLVALDPTNGEVLALVNRPSIDPNVFSGRISSDTWRALNDPQTKPLLNRAVQGLYPPGSTYKMVTAIAGLETGNLDRNTLFHGCAGSYTYGNRAFGCWLARGHGRLDVNEAIAQSCDVFFYQLTLAVGLDNWCTYGRAFGFGSPTGVDLPNEMTGLMPDRAYFDKRYGKNGWSKGSLLSLGIGQGELLVTPMQMAYYTATLANGGRRVVPHLMKKIVAPNGTLVQEYTGASTSVPGVSAKSFEIIRKAMVDVVGHGTGGGCALPGVTVAGKTGSAENSRGKTHAWFVAFAPAEAPRIALVVLAENAGHGGEVAVPIARKVLASFFNVAP
jgi:penicillin-binding protein 2